MGVGISGWKLAQTVSRHGELGVVSGTALDLVLARQLQLGDLGGHLRRALNAFPLKKAADRIMDRYFIDGGKSEDSPFLPVPQTGLRPSRLSQDLMLAGSFTHVFLSKEGHQNPVGINLLEKIKFPTLYVLLGAMLAGVDVVLMGAGIPRHIPGILDHLSDGTAVSLQIEGADEAGQTSLNPADILAGEEDASSLFPLKRPYFIAIVSSPTLARHLISKANGRIDGFVVEGHTAGGHNAPPRRNGARTTQGEPEYGPKDQACPEDFQALGLPFWLAGGYGRPGGLNDALARGASGIQVGTAFAFCQESGLAPDLKQSILDRIQSGDDSLRVFTDPDASPTGFPFKVVQVADSLSDPDVYAQRNRVCDIGLLRETFRNEDGTIQFRCPAESCESYVAKGGEPQDTERRMCLCNGLLATIGLGQVRAQSGPEPALVTAGDDINDLKVYLTDQNRSYQAVDVLNLLRTRA